MRCTPIYLRRIRYASLSCRYARGVRAKRGESVKNCVYIKCQFAYCPLGIMHFTTSYFSSVLVKDPVALWIDAALKSPNKARVNDNLGVVLKRGGRIPGGFARV